MKNKSLSMVAIVLSVVAAVLALFDAMAIGVWLSASSWLIVAVMFGVWAIYAKE